MEIKPAQVYLPSEATEGLYLHPGHLQLSEKATTITTVVGSCVSVCLWDRVSKVAGMNHFVLPSAMGGTSNLRHGDFAMGALIERLVANGAAERTLRARLFGGSCVIDAFRATGSDLGSKNVTVARRVLAQHHIPVLQEDVGGNRGRKLVFHTDDGTVTVKLL
jgi:chemotaxis protein CheD